MNAPVSTIPYKLSEQERLAFVLERIPQLKAVLLELFPGTLEVEIEEDPEIVGRQYVTFLVETSESVEVVKDRRREWYALKRSILGDYSDLVCLDEIFVE